MISPGNTTDFEAQLERCLRQRKRVCEHQIAVGPSERPTVTKWLEQHARDYFINSLLGAVHWQVTTYHDGEAYLQANLGVEVKAEPRSQLDYFGFDRYSREPLRGATRTRQVIARFEAEGVQARPRSEKTSQR